MFNDRLDLRPDRCITGVMELDQHRHAVPFYKEASVNGAAVFLTVIYICSACFWHSLTRSHFLFHTAKSAAASVLRRSDQFKQSGIFDIMIKVGRQAAEIAFSRPLPYHRSFQFIWRIT